METEDHDLRRKLVQQNQRLLQNLNTQRHCSCEVRQLVSEIIGQKIAASTEIRLPFYSDYGHNIIILKGNSCGHPPVCLWNIFAEDIRVAKVFILSC